LISRRVASAVAGRRRRALWLLALICAAPLHGAAQSSGDDLPGRIDLAWALERARTNNPEIQGAEARWRSMEQRPPQAGALPDPSITVRYHNEDWGLSFGSSDFSFVEVGIEQELPFLGKRALQRGIAESEALRERAMRDMTALMVMARVGMRYADLVAIERTNGALSESVVLLDALIAQAAARYSVGQAEQQDVLRARLERDALRERLLMLSRERASARADLAALLAVQRPEQLPPTADFDAPVELGSLTELRERAEAQSPALRAAREEWNRANEALALSRREYFPDFSLMAAYTDKKQLLPEWEVGLRVTVPIFYRSKQSRAAAEAAYGERAADHERRRTEIDVGARLSELHATAESSLRLLDLYRESLIPSAALTFESARASYATGRVDLLSTLSAFVALIDYRVREAEETARLLGAQAEMGPLIGATPLGKPLEDLP